MFPRAVHRRCVVHLVRNSLRYVPQKEAAAFCRSVRAVYGAPSLAAAESAWEAFRGVFCQQNLSRMVTGN